MHGVGSHALELATATNAALGEALCLLLCQECGALVIEFSVAALGDEFLGTSCNLLCERLHIPFGQKPRPLHEKATSFRLGIPRI